jgi:uncharacterized membrane protein
MRFKRLVLWFFILLPLLITLAVFPILPDTLPMHFDVRGNITRFGSKYELIFTGLLLAVIGLVFIVVERIALKNAENGTRNAKVVYWLNIVMMIIYTSIQVSIIYTAFAQQSSNYVDLDFVRIFVILLSIGWIVIGSLLPKCKRNFLIGIRTKWTLKSEYTWGKTHRLGGKIMMAYGLVSMILFGFIFSGILALILSVGGMGLVAIIVAICSFFIHKKSFADNIT